MAPKFHPRSISLGSRRGTWLRRCGYLACIILIIQTYVFLSNHPELSLKQIIQNCFRSPRILRPGQYQHVVMPSLEEVVDGDSADLVGMGMAHDRR